MPRTQTEAGAKPYLQRFGRKLRERRLQRRWSQELLAEKAGLDRSYISSLERGQQDPRLGTIRKLAKALNCRAAELVE